MLHTEPVRTSLLPDVPKRKIRPPSLKEKRRDIFTFLSLYIVGIGPGKKRIVVRTMRAAISFCVGTVFFGRAINITGKSVQTVSRRYLN